MELVQAWRSGLHYHHETEAYLWSFALSVASKSVFLDFDEDIETTKKLMVDVKFKRRGKTTEEGGYRGFALVLANLYQSKITNITHA